MMEIARMKGIASIAVIFALFWNLWGCSGKKYYPSVESAMLDTQEVEQVTFNVSGQAACSRCSANEVPVVGMQVELYFKGDPTESVALKNFNGLGPFSFTNIKALRDATVVVTGTLFLEGSAEPQALNGYTEISVPGDDGSTVAVTLNFPSSDSD